MRVAQLWRYPVKSMQGESLDSIELDGERVPGDREWGVRDRVTGTVLTGRTAGALLHASARTEGDAVCIELPDGRQVRDTDEQADLILSSYVGQPVHLAHAKADEQAAFAMPDARWRSMPGSFNDGNPVHVLTTASLRAAGALHPDGVWDPRRFRPNLVIDVDGDVFAEDEWASITIGQVRLDVIKRTTRCPMTARSQPGLDDDLMVLRTLTRNRSAKLGVYARVSATGRISAGDDVSVA